jgi:hypothetical protein
MIYSIFIYFRGRLHATFSVQVKLYISAVPRNGFSEIIFSFVFGIYLFFTLNTQIKYWFIFILKTKPLSDLSFIPVQGK